MKRRSIAIALLSGVGMEQSQTRTPPSIENLVREVRTASFPELSDVDIRVRPFASDSDYFQARFSILRFIFVSKMRYFIRVNSTPMAASIPEEASRAIVAHELA